MTVKEFFESRDKLVIPCDTQEKAEKLLNAFGKSGYTWASCDEYSSADTEWKRYEKYTAYSNNGHYGSWIDYLKEGWQILEFDEIEFEDASLKSCIEKIQSVTDKEEKEEKGPQSMKEEKIAIEKTLKKCAEFFGITKSICTYTYEYSDNKITIYTDRPGWWVGFHGNNITILKAALSTALHRDNVEVAFIELKGIMTGSIKIGE